MQKIIECFSKETADHWMNADFIAEELNMPNALNLCSIWTKALRDLGLHSNDEPFNELLCQGVWLTNSFHGVKIVQHFSVDHMGGVCPQCDSKLALRSAKTVSLGQYCFTEEMIEKYGAILFACLFYFLPTHAGRLSQL